MNISFRSRSRRRGLLAVCAVSATGMALVAPYAADDAKPNSHMILTPIEDARFVPVDPQRPQGAQMAVLWGDPNTGPSATLLRPYRER
jgi:hypothetical protein